MGASCVPGRAIEESRHGALFTGLRLDAARIFGTPYFRIGTLPITPAFLVKMLLFLLVLAFVCSRVARGRRRLVLDRAITSLDSRAWMSTTNCVSGPRPASTRTKCFAAI